jgi:predicted DNA repair protein MutK
MELGLDLITAQGLKGEAAEKIQEKFVSEKERQKSESEKVKEQAQEKEKESTHAEHKALRFDFAEGLFEIGLVMSSMFFLAHRKIFPAIGLLGGLAGTVLGVMGVLS